MLSSDIKDWSILIYANGNNELEPEISKAKETAETVGSNENVNIVMQIAREDRQLAKILRPFADIPISKDEWIGVRRYLIGLNGSKHLETLSNVNMADAKSLYLFIIWATENFPARHYMLILGGHGYQFVGCMTDYRGRVPYIMGIPELCNSIDFACAEAKIKIDILLMDTCYSNFIEVVYEFGKKPEHGVKYMLTYIINGPLVGLPYNEIIYILQNNYNETNIEYLTKEIINNLDSDVIVFKIDHSRLNIIKDLFDGLARFYVNLSGENKIGLPQLFRADNKDMPYGCFISKILDRINELIVGYKRSSNNIYPLINIANKPASDKCVIELYRKLAFSDNNYWTTLLYNNEKDFNYQFNEHSGLDPVILPPKAVYAYICIMNSSENSDIKKNIFINLLKYKNWKI